MKNLLLTLFIVVPFMVNAQVANPEQVLTKLSQSGYIAYVDNADSTQLATTDADKLIDGDPGTFWETDWHTGSPLPHWCVINMGSAQDIDGIYITHRAGQINGNGPDSISVYTSVDSVTWVQQFDSIKLPDQLDIPLEFTSTVNCQFYRIVIHTAADNGVVNLAETGALEINIPDPNAYERGEWTIISYSSQDDADPGPASASIDKNVNTYWQSRWQSPSADYPHIIVYDRGAAQAGTPINLITYVQRTNNDNSEVDSGTVAFSSDGTTWGAEIPLKFTYHGNSGVKNVIQLPTIASGRYIRFTMLRNLYATNNPGGDPTSGAFRATTIAEFGAGYDQFLADPTVYNRSGWSVTTPQGSPSGQGPENLIDGDMGTIWQSQWSGTPEPYPHVLIFDMGIEQPINLILYNTWKGGNFNSAADSGSIAFSVDGGNWGPEISMEFGHTNGERDSFLIPGGTHLVRYFRFTIAQNHYVAINGPGTSATHLATSLTEVWAVYNSSLPVQYTSPLSAKAVGNTILLDWETATEQNSSHFIITRSSDGEHFEAIGEVQAVGRSHQYSYVDNNPQPGINYYRLVQVDKDGRKISSMIAFARIDLATKPTLNIIKVSANGISLAITSPDVSQGTIRVYSISGMNMVGNEVVELSRGTNNVQVRINGAAGIYIVTVNTPTAKNSKQFFKP